MQGNSGLVAIDETVTAESPGKSSKVSVIPSKAVWSTALESRGDTTQCCLTLKKGQSLLSQSYLPAIGISEMFLSRDDSLVKSLICGRGQVPLQNSVRRQQALWPVAGGWRCYSR